MWPQLKAQSLVASKQIPHSSLDGPMGWMGAAAVAAVAAAVVITASCSPRGVEGGRGGAVGVRL